MNDQPWALFFLPQVENAGNKLPRQVLGGCAAASAAADVAIETRETAEVGVMRVGVGVTVSATGSALYLVNASEALHFVTAVYVLGVRGLCAVRLIHCTRVHAWQRSSGVYFGPLLRHFLPFPPFN